MSFRGGCFYKHKLHKYLPDGEVCLPQSQCMVQTTSQRATEIREGKVPYISFPCAVSSELLPANSSGEHGTQVTVPGDGSWTADRTSPPLWWEAQCCRCRMGGWMDGIRVEKEYRHWEGKRWVQPLTFCMQSGGFSSWLRNQIIVIGLCNQTEIPISSQLHKSMTKQSSFTP